MDLSVGQLIIGQPRDIYDVLSLILAFITVLAAIGTYIYTIRMIKNQKEQFNKQLYEQKTQWLYDSYIKNENEVLLKAKKLFLPAIESVHWCQFRLFPYGYFDREDQNIIESHGVKETDDNVRKEIVDYYNKIKEMHNFFVQNENIFIKHKQEEKLDYLNLFLDLLNSFPITMFKEKIAIQVNVHYQETNTDTIETKYKLKYWYTMMYIASIWPQRIGVNPDDVNAFIDKVNKDTVKKAEEVLYKATNELDSVGKYLNKITIWGHDEENIKPSIRQERRACRIEEIINPTESKELD